MSTAEAEYVAAASCYAQLLWMKQILKDFGVTCGVMPLLCDNESAIKIAHNLVQHERTKHIVIHHHYPHDHVNHCYVCDINRPNVMIWALGFIFVVP
jgi:hypothetical protein